LFKGKEAKESSKTSMCFSAFFKSIKGKFISLSSFQLREKFLSVGRVQTPTLAILVEREQEIMALVKELENSLPMALGIVKDSEPFFIDERRYLKIEYTLFKDTSGKIKILYTETPTPLAKSTQYKSSKKELEIRDYNLTMLELIYKRLPKFGEILLQQSKRIKK